MKPGMRCGGDHQRVFVTKIALGIFVHDLQHHSRPFSSVRVRKQGDLDMSVTDREESSRPVSRNSGQLHDQGQLHAVPLMVEHHLRGEEQGLEEFKLVLRTHDRLFPFLCA